MLGYFLAAHMSVFHDDLFVGKMALITGGATGIGFGIAEALARHGSDVAIVSRKQEKLMAAAEQIVATTGRRCLPLVADVRQPESVEAAVEQVSELAGSTSWSITPPAISLPSGHLSPTASAR